MTDIDGTNLSQIDLLTHGSPCQDFSISGKQGGADDGSGTRSSLMWQTVRIIHETMPKYVIWENVKNVLSQKHKHNFEKYIEKLSELGYESYYKVLNAKNYEIAQNRERVFVVSIRKDITDRLFEFPKGNKPSQRILDILEEVVDEKYFLDNEKTRTLIRQLNYEPIEEIRLHQIGNFEKLANNNKKFNDPQVGRVLDIYGICQSLDTMQGGNRQPKILIKPCAIRGRYSKDGGIEQRLEIKIDDTLNAITTVQKDSMVIECEPGKPKIRKLTPLECWRLMGFGDEDYYIAKQSLIDRFYNGKDRTNSQLYKQAGNSICVPVLEAVFESLFGEKYRNSIPNIADREIPLV